MAQAPCPVLVVTATIEGQFTKVYDAMGAGALDAVEIPTLGPDGKLQGGEALLRKIRMIRSLTQNALTKGSTGGPEAADAGSESERTGLPGLPPLIAIGASTGGPSALAAVLGSLPASLPAAVLVVQHLDANFTAGLVSWLAKRTLLKVTACLEPVRPMAGTVYVAARDAHLVLDDGMVLRYRDEPRDTPHRPSIDALFHSIAQCGAARGCGVLLTGMGRDGAEGLLAMRRAGFLTIAQDQESSVVWGMPGAAVALEAASTVLPLDDIAPVLLYRAQAERSSPPH
jgi:two-component system response regulator WspF